MTLEEKLRIFKDKGWTYNPETGNIFSHTGYLIKGKSSSGHITCSIIYNKKKITIQGHQLAWYLSYGKIAFIMLDHINRIKSDNRIVNIRESSSGENRQNNDAEGVSYDKRDRKWRAYIIKNGKRTNLGSYETYEESKFARHIAELKYFPHKFQPNL